MQSITGSIVVHVAAVYLEAITACTAHYIE